VPISSFPISRLYAVTSAARMAASLRDTPWCSPVAMDLTRCELILHRFRSTEYWHSSEPVDVA
jgi:hypothetical protein